ncbi:glycosyltransferase family 32 protein [Pedobacter sp. SL55]|uniref:glycosyltransferase family 32 protein n=1 Tax=Pedobacter sp. SL55 TaxID=2995161 RepID=UPI00226F0143|nr:glycosyltransferase [Pedobacter sp. SL55]WAC42073.1 glycosyltransferase [Pedobacter sp. SL55]
MIPKIIHYCWFGRGEMPKLALDCLASWKKFLPEYEIKLWNEDNFDFGSYKYAADAYKERKFAFVSDVCRLYVLKEFGGLYLDTDVEFIKPFPDQFLADIAFTGFEDQLVSAGVIGSVKNGEWVSNLLSLYHTKSFYKTDGSLDVNPITEMMTDHLGKEKGVLANNTYQKVTGYCTIYPSEYFYPKSWKTLKMNITPNTYCIHHFAGSWIDHNYTFLGKVANWILGKRVAENWSTKYRKFRGRGG